MVKLAGFSGQEALSILHKHFGFLTISQKGSHIKLRKATDVKIITIIIPNHKELAQGTLRNILRQAEINLKDFIKKR